MAVRLTYNDYVEYILQHEELSPVVIDEPIGWNNDEKEFSRHDDYHGIFVKHSNNLKFIGSGADYLTLTLEIYGINARVILRKRERNPKTNIFELSYFGFLDLSTYSIENNIVSVKFNSSGMEQLLKTRQNEKVEIDRTDTLDGDTLPTLVTKTVALKGRNIFLRSIFEANSNNQAKVSVETNAGGTRNQTCNMPIKIKTNEHGLQAQTPTVESRGVEHEGDLGMMFLLDMDRDRSIEINFSGKTDVFFQQYENVQWCRYKICLTIYENGFDFDVKQRYVLAELRSENPAESDDPADSFLVLPSDYDAPVPSFTIEDLNFSFSETLNLLEGESVAFEAFLKSDMFTDPHAGVRADTRDFILDNFTLEEASYFPETNSKMILNYELGHRIINIITGRNNVLYSEALGRTDIGYSQDGVDTGALNGFAHGFWVRGFDKLPEDDENKFKPFTTSFKDYMQNLKTTWNLGLGIERNGFSEKIIIENLKYFYNNNVLIRLGKEINGKFEYIKVNNVKRSVATEYYYSSIMLGYEKGWDNEEAEGLDEYNTQSNFATCIKSLKNDYESVSPYIAASYAKEFSRRKPFSEFPTTDHSYDKDVFVMDLKRGDTGVFEERTYESDFAELPSGTFSPANATNLRLSPFNLLLKHGWNISSGLQKHYPEKYVKYTSSEGNSKLETKQIGKPRYAENGEILNSELERPRYLPEWIEFEYQVDFEIMKIIEGTTEILGKKIPNFYGLVEFKNEKNQIEKGFLFNLKLSEKGEWKILKSNR